MFVHTNKTTKDYIQFLNNTNVELLSNFMEHEYSK